MRCAVAGKKSSRSVALKFIPDREKKRVDFEIIQNVKAQDVSEGTVRRGSATCPVCGYTTPVASVRRQLKARRGGAADARLFASSRRSRDNRAILPAATERDLEAVRKSAEELERRKAEHTGELSLVPDEPLPPHGTLGFRVQLYGMEEWGNLFTPRQALALTTLVRLVQEAGRRLAEEKDSGMAAAVQTCLALAVDRQADYLTSLVVWANSGEFIAHTFGRQALPIVWEWPECNPWAEGSGNWNGAINWISLVIARNSTDSQSIGFASLASVASQPIPDDSAQCIFTDPPYYVCSSICRLIRFLLCLAQKDNKKPARRSISGELTPKVEECIVDPINGKDNDFFQKMMARAMSDCRRVLAPNGLSVVVFAHKSTTGWEAQLQAMIDSGWIFTGSWPIDTERPGRLRAQDSAALASSIHLVCRPRENPDGEIRTDDVGDWRKVISELPARIHDWLPRLAKEGIVGADAIFSCLGPALEIYSRYSRVEKVNGEVVTLKEYLEEIWAAVSREALSTIFSGDTSGFEEDARITAMWLWTLSAGANGAIVGQEEEEQEDEVPAKSKVSGFVLEYDAARKIAQGLGVSLENIPSIVEVKKDKARLLPVSERAPYLLGRETVAPRRQKKERMRQMTLSGEVATEGTDESKAAGTGFAAGNTVLDRLHQAMLLFAAGQGEALSAFLQEQGQDQSLWSLAQALATLYPTGSEERRWVEGVLARKKSLGI